MLRRFKLPVPGSRVILSTAALCCFACAFALVPADVRSQLDSRQGESIPEAPTSLHPAMRPVPPEGDAFAPPSDFDDDVAAMAPRRAPRPPPATLGVALPDSRVTAIATGARPTAIVESGASVRAVSIGDPLDGSHVTSILDDAVRLENGKRLLLMPGASTP